MGTVLPCRLPRSLVVGPTMPRKAHYGSGNGRQPQSLTNSRESRSNNSSGIVFPIRTFVRIVHNKHLSKSRQHFLSATQATIQA